MKSDTNRYKSSSTKKSDTLDSEIQASRLFLPSDQRFLDHFGIPVEDCPCVLQHRQNVLTRGGGP